MKSMQTIIRLALLLAVCSIIHIQAQPKEMQQSEDSYSSENSPKPLPLAYTCISITFNGKQHDRSPIVLLHGFTWFKEFYMDLAQFLALKTGRRVCAVDLRNHGASPWSEETDSKAMAADIALFVKKLDTDKVVIVGHSLGGKIAVEFALTYPDKVEKLVVEEMRPNGLSEEALKLFGPNPSWQHLRNLVPQGMPEYEAKKIVSHFYNAIFEQKNITKKYDESLIDYIPIKCSDNKCSWKTNFDAIEKIAKDPLKFWPDNNGKTEKPALFIYGEVSPFKIGDVKEEIFELFPQAKLFEVKGREHILNVFPEYRNEVVNFINAKD